MDKVDLCSTSFAEKLINSNYTDETKAYCINMELLKRIKKLETDCEDQHNLIDDQNKQIKFLNNRNADLKKSNKLSFNNLEQLDQTIRKLNQENVSLRLEDKVYQRKAEILNLNVEDLQKCCDELQTEITELHPEIEQIDANESKKPIVPPFANCCLEDPECPKFGKKLIFSDEEEQKDEKGVETPRLQIEQKVLAVFKCLLDEKRQRLAQTETKLQELENELAMKKKYQQTLILQVEERKKCNELITNLYDEIQGEKTLCENCCQQIECSFETLSMYSMSSSKYSDFVDVTLPQASNLTPIKRRSCMHMSFKTLFAHLREKLELSKLTYWTDLAEVTSMYTMYGGDFYLNKNEKCPCDCIK